MSHDDGKVCGCVRNHSPQPLELNKHHVWPLAMGGPDVPENWVWVCPTTHTNVHELLRRMVAAGRVLGFRELTDTYDVTVSQYAWRVACEGYRRSVGV